ncbi:hypothetical protein RB594_009920 [Gaeumannomyces avenae]
MEQTGLDHGSADAARLEGQLPRKRQRVPVACGLCRARKSKCDGLRPKCSSCTTQGTECSYAQAAAFVSSAAVPKSYLDLVEARLAKVERDIHKLNSQFGGISLAPETDASGPDAESWSDVQGSAAGDDRSGSFFSLDATDGVGTIELTDEQDSAYFGPSSNIAFTRALRRALSSFMRDKPTTPASPLSVSRPQSPALRMASDAWLFSNQRPASESHNLPPEAEMVQLIRHYFSDTSLLFPFIHEDTFRATYRVARASNFRRVRQSWLSLLYMVLAIAATTNSQADMDGPTRAARAEAFFTRAKSLSLNQMIAGAGVEITQVMLLMTQFLQGSQRSAKTWMIHGLAVNAAFQLGLQSEEALNKFEPLEREIRLRTWHHCVILDRSLSMTLGRPPSIPEKYVRVPLPRHNGPMQHFVWSTEENSTLFFNATITLYRITQTVIDTLYGCNLGETAVSSTASTANAASSTVQIEQQLLEWESSLTPPLKIVRVEELLQGDGPELPKKLRAIITLRYHNLRILAHRPMLEQLLGVLALSNKTDPRHDANMLWQFGARSITICFQSAEAIIGIVDTATRSASGLLGAWWFSLYFIFNAALAVAAVLLSDQVGHSPETYPTCPPLSIRAERQLQVLNQAIECMPLLDSGNPVLVEKCTKFLSGLVCCLRQGLAATAAGPSLSPAGAAAAADAIGNLSAEGFASVDPQLAGLKFTPDGINSVDFQLLSFLGNDGTRDLFW